MNQLCDSQKKPWLNAAVNSLTIQSGASSILAGAAGSGGGIIQVPLVWPNAAYPAGTTLLVASMLPYGGVVSLTGSATAGAITLPPIASATPGVSYKFIVNTAPTASITITTDSAANILQGAFLLVSVGTPVTAKNNLVFVLNAALIGDWVRVTSNGTWWFVEGNGKAAGGITTS